MSRRKLLYHGTSLHRWKLLEWSDCADTLYLADSADGTEMYRRNAIEMDEIDGVPGEDVEVVVVFDLDKLAKDGELEPDWDDVPTNMELFPDASWPGQVTWQDSLKKLGTCAYTGPIKNAVVKVRKIK